MLIREAFDIRSEHECIIDEWKEDIDDAFSMVMCRCHAFSFDAKMLYPGDTYTCPTTGAHARLA